MHTIISYVVFNKDGLNLGEVKTRADIQKLLRLSEVPCRKELGTFSLEASHLNSLQEVDFNAIENVHNVTCNPDLSIVHYDVYDKDAKYRGCVSTRQDLLSILPAEQIISKYESYSLDACNKNSLQEVNLRAIEDQTEMTFVLLAPVGHHGFRG